MHDNERRRAGPRGVQRAAAARNDEPAPTDIPAGLLRLQATAGNRAVRALSVPARLQRQAGEAGSENDLTAEEEREWLEADTPVQRDVDTPIQRAWTGRRQLSGLGWLGRPWVVRKSDNIVNLRLYHEHIFFEDSGTPPDIGHMGQQGLGLGQDPGRTDDYSRVREDLNDTLMRMAVRQRGDPGPYGLLTNNCQDYVQSVLRIYDRLKGAEGVGGAGVPA